MGNNIADLSTGPILSTIVYSIIGLVIYMIAFWLICKISPFSVRKEIEIDQNTSLGIIIGSVMIGLSIIIASSMH
ncbi:MAG TPA: DUF350 domain-containing protein [Candidatus Rifleibacterium sp.]|nr:DUF350 domain-containing protein [Candidatus Rifleibacterium sp.]HPT44661.1 DUF350 domain-containing protein [Candidatus Rifleibacterium sp.]